MLMLVSMTLTFDARSQWVGKGKQISVECSRQISKQLSIKLAATVVFLIVFLVFFYISP